MEEKIIRLKEIDSTNRFLRELKDEQEDEMVVAVADFQTAGKGQGSHTWESEAGKNLLFSIKVHPRWVPVRQQFLLSMAGAIAIKEALETYVDGITLKWPNDVYWNDKKISRSEEHTSELQENQRYADRDLHRFKGYQDLHLWYRHQCQPGGIP